MTDSAQLNLVIKSLEVATATSRLEKLEQQAKKTEQAAHALARGAAAQEAAFNRVHRVADKFTKTMLRLGRAYAGVVSAVKAFKVLESFEFAMAQVKGIVIDTTLALEEQMEQFRQLSRLSRDYGATTEYSAQQAANAELALGRAGFSTKEIIQSLGDTLDLATAGVIDLGSAAKITSNTIRQFNLDAGQTREVVDALVFAANKSNTTVGELGQAMSHAGSLAASLGVTVQETTAALAVLANKGITASKAGTALRGVMTRLLNPTGEAADILKNLAERSGQSTLAFNLMANPLKDVISNLRTAGATAKELETIFGRFQIAGALGLVRSSDALQAMTAATIKAKDEGKRLATTFRDTLRVEMRNLVAAVEAFVLSLGDAGLKDALRNSVRFVVAVVRDLAGLRKSLVEISPAATTTANAIRALGIAIVAHIAGLTALNVVTGTYTAVTVVATGATKAFAVALAASPLSAFGLAVGAVSFIVYQFRDSMVKTADGVFRFGDIVSSVFEEIWERIKKITEIISKRIARTFGYLVGLVKGLFDKYFEAVGAIGDIFTRVANWIGDVFREPLKIMLALIRGVVNKAIGLFAALVTLVDVAINRIIRAGRAFARIDITSPIKSIRDVAAELGDTLSPGSILDELKAQWKEDFTKDWVSLIAPAFEAAKSVTKELFTATFHRVFSPQDFADFSGLADAFDPGSFAENVRKRLAEKLAARQALAAQQAADEARLQPSFSQKALKAFSDQFAPIITQATHMYNVLNEVARQYNEQTAKAKDNLKDYSDALDFDVQISNHTADFIQRAQELERVRKIAVEAFGGDLQKVEEYLTGIRQRLIELSDVENLRRIGETVGDAFGSFFNNMITQAKSAKEAIADLGRSLLQLAFQETVGATLRNGFATFLGSFAKQTPTTSANGNAFVNGSIQKFGKGGAFNNGYLINQPTLFSAGGQAALGGELDTEAIMPLRRLANGRLGVESTGGSGKRIIQNTTNVTMNVTATDASSFRRSQSQLTRDLQRAVQSRRPT